MDIKNFEYITQGSNVFKLFKTPWLDNQFHVHFFFFQRQRGCRVNPHQSCDQFVTMHTN